MASDTKSNGTDAGQTDEMVQAIALLGRSVGSGRRDENPALVYLASLAPGSRRAMGDALTIVAGLLTNHRAGIETLPWGQLRYQHTMAVRAALAERYSAATVNKFLSALRGTLKAAWRLGQMSAEEMQRASDLPRVQGETLPAGRSLSAGEIVALMEACLKDAREGRPAGVRDAAILSLLYGCGLRRAEVASLRVEDFQRDGSEGLNGSSNSGPVGSMSGALKIRGKRNKERLVPVVGGAAAALSDWLLVRGETVSGPLLCPTKKSKTGGVVLVGKGMTAQAIYLILLERARDAGVAHFSPHDCRRTFVGDLLDRGADIATVQKLAGHANVTTTARYDRRGETAKRKAAELLHVPYRVGPSQ